MISDELGDEKFANYVWDYNIANKECEICNIEEFDKSETEI